MIRLGYAEEAARINENERLEEESLEADTGVIENAFRKRNDEINQEFDELADEIKEKFNQKANKIEKRFNRTSFVIFVIALVFATLCSAFFNAWFDSSGFTDYYRPFDEIKSLLYEQIEEPFSLSVVFTNTSEATVTLDFDGEANDTSFILENVKWDLKDKQIYLKESVVESIIEKYEASKNNQ